MSEAPILGPLATFTLVVKYTTEINAADAMEAMKELIEKACEMGTPITARVDFEIPSMDLLQ